MLTIGSSHIMRIEICGGIASGKTTLATLLRDLGCAVIYEAFAANPFWEVFYSDPDKYKFETELTFLLQHYHGIKSTDESGRAVVCDYSLLQDICYCDATLTGLQRQTYAAVHEQVMREIGQPSLLIHLYCDVNEELERIGHRGRKEEKDIGASYLESINNAIRNRLTVYAGDVLAIDTGETNLVNSEADKGFVRELIRSRIDDSGLIDGI